VTAAPEPRGTTAEDAVARELHRLAEQVTALQAEVRRLADEPRPLPAERDEGRLAEAPSYAWLGSLEPPLRRRPAVPRFLLESAFLVAAAALAAAAELEPPLILAVMAGAWAIVALAEVAAGRAERRRDVLLLPPAPPAPAPADAAWFSPPVEHTLLDGGASTDSPTAVTRLPPQLDEATVEQRPPR
jgi:hypothetical protein